MNGLCRKPSVVFRSCVCLCFTHRLLLMLKVFLLWNKLALVFIHAKVGACWLGSNFYSTTILNFKTPLYLLAEESEEFLLKITLGNRYHILATSMTVVLTATLLLFYQKTAGLKRFDLELLQPKFFSLIYVAIFCWVCWVVYP